MLTVLSQTLFFVCLFSHRWFDAWHFPIKLTSYLSNVKQKGFDLDEYSTNETLLKQGLSWTQSNEILASALKFFEYYIDISLQIMKKKKINSFLYMNILALEGFGEQNCSRER